MEKFTVRNYMKFLREFVRAPGVIGAISPSSANLAQKMIEWIEWEKVKVVVELGPGTGAFTQRILDQMPDDGRYLGVEINPQMCRMLQKRFDGITLHQGTVANLENMCGAEGVAEVDSIISGLPWASFSDGMQTEYLDAIMKVLRRDGQFVTFAYLQGMMLSAGQRFRKKLTNYFTHVSRSQISWLNLPPAFVYRCRR